MTNIISVKQVRPSLESTERAWVRSELSRTDNLVDLSDYGYKTELLEYRQSLKDYDCLGQRPDTPITKSGDTL